MSYQNPTRHKHYHYFLRDSIISAAQHRVSLDAGNDASIASDSQRRLSGNTVFILIMFFWSPCFAQYKVASSVSNIQCPFIQFILFLTAMGFKLDATEISFHDLVHNCIDKQYYSQCSISSPFSFLFLANSNRKMNPLWQGVKVLI